MVRIQAIASIAVLLAIASIAHAQAKFLAPTVVTPPTDSVEEKTALPPVNAPAQLSGPEANSDKLTEIDKKLDAISKSLTVTTGDSSIKVILGGALIGDFLYNSGRPVAPGTPFFLTPGPVSGFRQQTFDASARQSMLSAIVVGPDVCGFQSSAVILVDFYSSSLIQDLWGLLPLQAYAQLKNNDWRFAAGLQMDIFNPLNPTVLPLSLLGASGNTGAFRGQLRVERYLHPDDNTEITLTAGISDPVPTTVNNSFQLNEDNGWPNIEGRAAWAFGLMTGEGLEAKRPFEWGVSGVIGQMRTTIPGTVQVVAQTWGFGTDLRWALNDRFGFQGEYYVGETLGTYMGGALQNINSTSLQGIHSTGGWIEVYYYLCPNKLHTHIGYGIDDPRDSDLAIGQVLRNDTVFANLIWDVTKHFRLACEATYRSTDYVGLRNNDGFGIQGQVQLKF